MRAGCRRRLKYSTIMASTSSTTDRHCSGPDTAHHHHRQSAMQGQQLRPALRRHQSDSMTATTTASNCTASSTASNHPYLGDRQVDAIESWKTTVPAKSTCPIPTREDPVIEAYLQTKMALFQSLVSAKDAGRDSNNHHHRHVDRAGDRAAVTRQQGSVECGAE